MPSKIQVNEATSILYQESGGDQTFTLKNLANAALRQTPKVDLGDPRPRRCSLKCIFQGQATPTAGAPIYIYASYSNSGTAGTANDGGASGTDAAYTVTGGTNRLQLVGTFICSAVATTDMITTFVFETLGRYVQFITDNECGVALVNTDNVSNLRLTPLDDEVQ